MEAILDKNYSISDFKGSVIDKWDGKTFYFYCQTSGFGNMFGGAAHGIFGVVHGNNSVEIMGKVEIKGSYTYGYNIGRGANGPNSSIVTANHDNGEILGKLETTHICGADDALFKLLDYKKISLIEEVKDGNK